MCLRQAIEDDEPGQGDMIYKGDGPGDGPVPLDNLVHTMYLKSQRTGIELEKILIVFLTWAKTYVRQQIRKWMDEHPLIREFEQQFHTERRSAEECAAFIAWLKRWAEDEPQHDALFEIQAKEEEEDDRQWVLKKPTLILGEPEEPEEECGEAVFDPSASQIFCPVL